MNTGNIKQLVKIKKDIEKANQSLKELKHLKQEVEFLIMKDLEADGASLSCTKFGTVSISKTTVPSVLNWSEFEKYVFDNQALYLLQRRASSTAYREEIKLKGAIPGVESFEVTALNYSNKKST